MDWEIIRYILDTSLAVLITFIAGWFAWETTKMVDEQKKRRRNLDEDDNS